MCYIHVTTPHNECHHYILQTYTIKNKNKKGWGCSAMQMPWVQTPVLPEY